MKKFLALSLALALIFSLAGCKNEKEAENNDASSLTKDEIVARFLEKADEVVISDSSVTFTDGAGSEVTIEKNPQKTASLYNSLTTLWYEAGGSVTGAIGSEQAKALYIDTIGRDITEDEGVEVLATFTTPRKWNMENIIASSPDLFLVSTAMGGYDTLKGPAKAANIPVIAADYDDLSDYLKWFKVFSALTGNENLFNEVALKTLDEAADIIASAPKENNPTVFSMFATAKSIQANTRATVTGGMLNDLNAKNIVDTWENPENSSRLTVNLESVYAADPDIIFVQCMSSIEEAEEMVEETFGSNPVWKSLRAVKEGNVHYLPKELFHNKPTADTMRHIRY